MGTGRDELRRARRALRRELPALSHPVHTGLPGPARRPQGEEENARAYAESQRQRALERRLREEKRGLAVLEAQGAGEGELRAQRARVRAASADIDAFCDETGRTRRRSRESAPVKAAWPEKGGYDPAEFPRETQER